MQPKLRFDDSFPSFVGRTLEIVGREALERGAIAFLRDATGVITAIEREALKPEMKEKLASELQGLTPYVDADFPVLTPAAAFDDALGDENSYIATPIALGDDDSVRVLFLDRRYVGADWLRPALEKSVVIPPIFSFVSIKGGVGRTTALAVAAQEFAAKGLRVLAIDLDLEAPGLGSFLLPAENRPLYGALDFYVERGASSFDGLEFHELMEPSPVLTAGAPVFVVPAFGLRSNSHPQNVMAKLSLAYTEEIDANGTAWTFLDRTKKLIRGLCEARDFDIVLVDARAGLHETLAASLIGLGAEILMFGTFQSQTFEGYLPLLSQLSSNSADRSTWSKRLRMIHSKADVTDGKEIQGFRDSAHSLFRATIYDQPAQTLEDFEEANPNWYNADDPDGPHYPWIIANSAQHRLFDPIIRPAQVEPAVYNEAFGELLANLLDAYEARIEAIDAN
ncbi:KGGVGR-motif variant AAA ATPase [Novosphingobium sp. YAF33]|uniref:KGGVGR-motif variant AAA ATPase n=1 Tax=Novosphingobium sp. YAF33 TaxID=3233082 RepID=UPI003F9D3814